MRQRKINGKSINSIENVYNNNKKHIFLITQRYLKRVFEFFEPGFSFCYAWFHQVWCQLCLFPYFAQNLIHAQILCKRVLSANKSVHNTHTFTKFFLIITKAKDRSLFFQKKKQWKLSLLINLTLPMFMLL